MIVTTQEVDVTEFLPNQPTVYLERTVDPSGHNDVLLGKGSVAPDGIWYVPSKAVPVFSGAAFEWRERDFQITKIGDYVRIPLWHYQPGASAPTLVGMGAAVGAVLAAGMPPEYVLRRVHIALGQVFQNEAAGCYDAYVGLGLQVVRRRG